MAFIRVEYARSSDVSARAISKRVVVLHQGEQSGQILGNIFIDICDISALLP